MDKSPEINLEALLEQYDKLAEKLLGIEGQTNQQILAHALLMLASGYSPYQTVIRSHLFELALKVNNAKGITERMDIVFSLTPALFLIKEWKDKNLISPDFWSTATSTIKAVTDLNKEQVVLLKEVLEELNRIKPKNKNSGM